MNLYNRPMFKSLDIKNFRGIQSAEIDGFERVNLFFGKNNCGKSTVLEALFLISGQSNPLLPLSVNSMRNYMRFSESDLNIEFFGLNPENKINISVNGDENRWLEISRIKSQSNVVEL
ncbi:MAG: ATP-binding protein, partial [Duncaniella sp.]|nr:ATP-binding protein [Duncaniella sp.]